MQRAAIVSIVFVTILSMLIWLLYAFHYAPRAAANVDAFTPPLPLVHAYASGAEGALAYRATYTGDVPPGALSKWLQRSGSMAIAVAPILGAGAQPPNIETGDILDLRFREKDEDVGFIAPLMGVQRRRHLLMYVLTPVKAETKVVTLASLVAASRGVRFYIDESRVAFKSKATKLIEAAWKTAVAPLGVSGGPPPGLGGDVIDSSDSAPVSILVMWANASYGVKTSPREIFEKTSFKYPSSHEPRFVTYYDSNVEGTAETMQVVAPYLRPDRVMLLDADGSVRVVTLAYAPDLLIVRGEAKMTPDHVDVLNAITRELFAQTDDPGALAAECALVQKTAGGVEMRSETMLLASKYFTGSGGSPQLPYKPVVLKHTRSVEEGFTTDSVIADLVPMHAVRVVSLEYPREFRDSDRSVRHVHVSDVVIDGVTLSAGDRVTLTQQADSRENGRFFVIHVDPDAGYATLESPIVVRGVPISQKHIEGESGEQRWRLFASSNANAAPAAKFLREGDEILWVPPAGDKFLVTLDAVHGSAGGLEGTAPTEKSYDSLPWLHPLSRCSADPAIPTMQLCAKKWDVADAAQFGPSVSRAVWDRPCNHDVDCPFYDEKSRRFGCLGGGQCAMPIGVRRVGNRGYDRKPTLF